MSKAKLPVVFCNGDYTIKNKEVEIEVMGPSVEIGKELGFELSNYLMETFDHILEKVHSLGGAAPAEVAKIAEMAEVLGNVLMVAEIISDTAFLITEIVDAVRAANTTTFVFVNAVPDSTLRIDSTTLTDGSWVGVSEATIKQEKAVNEPGARKGTALIFNSQPYRSGGLQKGHLNLGIQFAGSYKETITFSWDNPLGIDRKGREATYQTNLTQQNIKHRKIMATVMNTHSSKIGKRRHDIVTVLLCPTVRYFQLPQVQRV